MTYSVGEIWQVNLEWIQETRKSDGTKEKVLVDSYTGKARIASIGLPVKDQVNLVLEYLDKNHRMNITAAFNSSCLVKKLGDSGAWMLIGDWTKEYVDLEFGFKEIDSAEIAQRNS